MFGFCVDISFQRLWVNPKDCESWIDGNSMIGFVKSHRIP